MDTKNWLIDGVVDLDAAASARAEVDGTPRGVRKGGELYPLPAEMPIDVFEPFLDVSQDIAMLVQDAWRTMRSDTATAEQRDQAGELVLTALIANPDLPRQVVEALRTATSRLFCDEPRRVPAGGQHAEACVWTRFSALRLTDKDVRVLFPGLLTAYGVSLGEVFAPSSSSGGSGTTSTPTSGGTTDSTSGTSGSAPETPGSSAPAGSSAG